MAKARAPGRKKTAFGAMLIVMLGFFLFMAVFLLPEYGAYQNKQVSDYYLEHGLEDTGSPSIVNAIVWDYRSYDTLGEEIVLVAATIGIVLLAGRRFL